MSSTLIRMARLPVAYQRNAPFVAILDVDQAPEYRGSLGIATDNDRKSSPRDFQPPKVAD